MASDVQISIGAKDTASKALKSVGQSAKRLQTDMGRLGNAAKGLMSAFAPLLGIFAAVKAVQGIASTISEANDAFLIQEKAARGSTEAQREYASQVQRVLGIGDEVSLQLMKQAELLGISKDQTDEAAMAAIGLAKATGTGTSESLKKVTQAMNGNANALAEVIPSIRDMQTEEEKLAAINELVTRGLDEQKAQMSGLEGIQTRATNSWGDMLEVIGQILAPLRAIIAQGFAVFAETMQSVLVPAVNLASDAMAALPTILDWVSQAVVGAITFVEVVVTNFPKIVEAAVLQAELYWTQLAETVKHVFTVTIPSYLQWFGDNWLNMLADVFNAGLTIAQNYVRNYADILIRLWEYVSSGFSGGAEALFTDVANIATRSLLDGFESQTASLPEIAERKLTEKEQSLKDRIGQIGADLGTQFASKFDARMQAVGETFEGFSTQANLTANQAAATLQKAAATTGTLTATESRLQTRGTSDDPNAKIVGNTADTVKQLRETNRKLERIADKPTADISVGVASA